VQVIDLETHAAAHPELRETLRAFGSRSRDGAATGGSKK
jgi:hypothetical protein